MSTPILNPNSSSTVNTNTNPTSSPSQIQIELSKTLYQHDPNAIRLYDFINHVKVFLYNSNELHWENHPHIEGNLFVYEKKQIINNQIYRSFAFAVINGEQNLIQEITSNMPVHADKLCLFYEAMRNDKHEVFGLHFLNENECQRLYGFINRSIRLIQNIKQSRATITSELQLAQTNEQKTSTNVYRQQTPVNIQNSTIPRETPIHLTVQQSTPVINDNSNTEDPTSSLKRLLNIPNPNGLEQQSLNLLPPSAFEAIPSSSIGAECDKQITREHFRNVLLHLVRNSDHFYDIIHQACHTHQS